MIFNKTVFKKLLKTAYKGAGLLVANKEGRIIIAGSWWVMSMEEKVFTYDGRAALVELTGQLPMPGECWRSTSAGNQIEIPPDYINIDDPEVFDRATAKEPYEKTILTMNGIWGEISRLYQKGCNVIPVNEIVDMLLDPSQTMKGEDYNITGPYTTDETTSFLYWYTDNCAFMAMKTESEDYKEILTYLAETEIPRIKS